MIEQVDCQKTATHDDADTLRRIGIAHPRVKAFACCNPGVRRHPAREILDRNRAFVRGDVKPRPPVVRVAAMMHPQTEIAVFRAFSVRRHVEGVRLRIEPGCLSVINLIVF